MKIAAILLLLCSLSPAGETVKTNARLPGDEVILPQPESSSGTKVTAMWKSSKSLASWQQGNRVTTHYLVTYEITGAEHAELGKELSFICKDSNPAPESRIRMKKRAWPFHGGSMTFWLTRDETCHYMPYFNINRYEPLLRGEN